MGASFLPRRVRWKKPATLTGTVTKVEYGAVVAHVRGVVRAKSDFTNESRAWNQGLAVGSSYRLLDRLRGCGSPRWQVSQVTTCGPTGKTPVPGKFALI